MSVHLYKERVYRLHVPTSRIDPRYGAVRAVLPPETRLGYLTDAPLEGGQAGRMRYDALYALAPLQLVDGAEARFVLADLRRPDDLAALCARHGLSVVASFENGTALLERR